jgi:hypothetical protein
MVQNDEELSFEEVAETYFILSCTPVFQVFLQNTSVKAFRLNALVEARRYVTPKAVVTYAGMYERFLS